MKILIDMNLSPDWTAVFTAQGYEAAHWSTIGAHNATDAAIMAYALANGSVVFTHDLDFGAILAATNAAGPSVLQLRAQNILPDALENLVLAVLRQFALELEAGALLIIDVARNRVRSLPLRRAEVPDA